MNDCQKRFYATKSEVRDMVKFLRKRRRQDVRFYQCPDCDGWHVTTSHSKLKFQLRNSRKIMLREARELIQDEKAEFVERVSSRVTIWRVVLSTAEGLIVNYNKRSKSINIIERFNPLSVNSYE